MLIINNYKFCHYSFSLMFSPLTEHNQSVKSQLVKNIIVSENFSTEQVKRKFSFDRLH